MAYRKITFPKLKLLAAALTALMFTSNLAALGLGALNVKSNLDQPLSGEIELRVSPGDNLDTVKASIASAQDYEKLGVDYPDYMDDISLSIENIDGRSVLHVSSNEVVIKEPFIHLLVRIDWSGGSFLREYTALIDPPVYAAETPKTLAEPQQVGVDQSYQTDDPVELEVEELDQSPDISNDEEVAEENVDQVFDQLTEEQVDEAQVDDEVIYQEPVEQENIVAETVAELPTDARYGPVASGESLSLIAAELQRQFPDLSIYQIMQVLFNENQGAFINGNINGLLQGAILNIGDINAIRAVEVVQAKQFFYEHLTDWDPSVLLADTSSSDAGLGVAQDEYSYDDLLGDAPTSSANDQLVDSFQVGASTDTQSLVSGVEGDNRDGEVIALQQQISDLQSSLSSSTLENLELSERISLLEGQLTDMNRLISLNVEDADLANLEKTLADQNNGDQLNNDLAANEVADSDFIDDGFGLAEPVASLGLDAEFVVDSTTPEDSIASEFVDTDVDTLEEEQINSDIAAGTPTESIESKPAIAPVAKIGFIESIKSTVMDNGLWKILAGLGALLLGGLGLFFFRRRRADEEYEISMLSIETQSQSVQEEGVSRSITEVNADDKSPDRETSFLTVYSDSDAVVQADEVDPIAEADVYIAYGRDEQAEEVLLDGVARKPERVDIKQKLLTLYHKNNNVEGFERIAEELYSQKNILTSDVWQAVSLMGKDISPENPLFEVSTAELLADEGLTNTVEETLEIEGSDRSVSAQTDEADLANERPADHASFTEHLEFSQEDPSINLINFDEDRSEISELDEVSMGGLEVDYELSQDKKDIDVEQDDDEIETSVLIIDDDSGSDDESELGEALEFERIDISAVADDDDDDDDEQAISVLTASAEVSDLEVDEDYDETRTQYELAKVFVDLGDEEGARKILADIVANDDSTEDVVADAVQLLEAINS